MRTFQSLLNLWAIIATCFTRFVSCLKNILEVHYANRVIDSPTKINWLLDSICTMDSQVVSLPPDERKNRTNGQTYLSNKTNQLSNVSNNFFPSPKEIVGKSSKAQQINPVAPTTTTTREMKTSLRHDVNIQCNAFEAPSQSENWNKAEDLYHNFPFIVVRSKHR